MKTTNIINTTKLLSVKAAVALAIATVGLGVASAADDSPFEGREWSLSAFGGWIDKEDSKLTPGAGLTYFLTKHFGAGAFTHWENYEGTFFDNISAEGYFRLPLNRLAPYALVSFGYSFETEETFEAVGAGAEWRFAGKLGLFSDVRWLFNNDTDDGIAIRAGVRWKF